MITALARLIGVTALGAWLDRRPPLLAAWLRLVAVVLLFGLPLVGAIAGRLTYADAFWWLWIDAFVVGVWTLVTLISRRADAGAITFFAVHYLFMFTLIPGVLFGWLLGRQLPPAQAWATLVVLAAASLVLQGWVTRRRWWPPSDADARRPTTGEVVALSLWPYLRLAVVYAGLFLPLAIPAVAQFGAQPVTQADAAGVTVWLLAIKLGLELLLALVHVVRVARR